MCVLFARKGHPLLAEPPERAAAAIPRFPFVVPSDSRPYGAVIREMYAAAGARPSPTRCM